MNLATIAKNYTEAINGLRVTDSQLETMRTKSVTDYCELESKITDGETIIEGISKYKECIKNNTEISETDRNAICEQLDNAINRISQKIQDLQTAQEVAMDMLMMADTVVDQNKQLFRRMGNTNV